MLKYKSYIPFTFVSFIVFQIYSHTYLIKYHIYIYYISACYFFFLFSYLFKQYTYLCVIVFMLVYYVVLFYWGSNLNFWLAINSILWNTKIKLCAYSYICV